MNQRENKEELENRISSLNYAKSQEEEKRLEFFINKPLAEKDASAAHEVRRFQLFLAISNGSFVFIFLTR